MNSKYFDCFMKGLDGEVQVRDALEDMGMEVIHNLILERNDRTKQIDLIAFDKSGVYVIEVKNVKGEVFGFNRQRVWKTVLFFKSYEMYNPVFQNQGHVRELVRYMKDNDHTSLTDRIYNVVVFPEDTVVETDATEVMTLRQLEKFIKSNRNEQPDSIDVNKLMIVRDELEEYKKDNLHLVFKHKGE